MFCSGRVARTLRALVVRLEHTRQGLYNLVELRKADAFGGREFPGQRLEACGDVVAAVVSIDARMVPDPFKSRRTEGLTPCRNGARNAKPIVSRLDVLFHRVV